MYREHIFPLSNKENFILYLPKTIREFDMEDLEQLKIYLLFLTKKTNKQLKTIKELKND